MRLNFCAHAAHRLQRRQPIRYYHWQPGHWFSLWKECRAGDLSVTDRVGKEILSLPLYSELPLSTVHQVADKVHTYFGRHA